MIMANDLNFDFNNSGILFSGAQKTGQALQMIPKPGDSVSLKKGNIEIEVQILTKNSDGTYSGKVKYVDPYQALLEDGVDDGIDICFSHDHIFSCSH